MSLKFLQELREADAEMEVGSHHEENENTLNLRNLLSVKRKMLSKSQRLSLRIPRRKERPWIGNRFCDTEEERKVRYRNFYLRTFFIEKNSSAQSKYVFHPVFKICEYFGKTHELQPISSEWTQMFDIFLHKAYNVQKHMLCRVGQQSPCTSASSLSEDSLSSASEDSFHGIFFEMDMCGIKVTTSFDPESSPGKSSLTRKRAMSYLGDEPSGHGDGLTERSGIIKRRSFTMGELRDCSYSRPMLLPMPGLELLQKQEGTVPKAGGIADFLKSIKTDSWILPHIITAFLLVEQEHNGFKPADILYIDSGGQEQIELHGEGSQDTGHDTGSWSRPHSGLGIRRHIKNILSLTTSMDASCEEIVEVDEETKQPSEMLPCASFSPAESLSPNSQGMNFRFDGEQLIVSQSNGSLESMGAPSSCTTPRSATISSPEPSLLPHISLPLFSSTEYLGEMFLCRQHPFWEKKSLLRISNFLFEFGPGRNIFPTGYACLDSAKVNIVEKNVCFRDKLTHQTHHMSRILRVSFYLSSNYFSDTQDVLICMDPGSSEREDESGSDGVERLYRKLQEVTQTQVNELYHITDGPENILGRGRYSEVLQARNPRRPQANAACESGTISASQLSGECALKVVDKRAYQDAVNSKQERADTLVREVVAHMQLGYCYKADVGGAEQLSAKSTAELQHLELPFVELLGIHETRESFMIEMERMQQQDLYSLLYENGPLPENQVRHIALQLVQATALCQYKGIAHRDIKLSNIGFPCQSAAIDISRQNLNLMQIKLADFGMAGFADKDGLIRGRCGTPGCVAPEILSSGTREGYPLNVDLFSIGATLYCLLCGYEPFGGDTTQEILESNRICDVRFDDAAWSHISSKAKDFVKRAMHPISHNRLTVHAALRHPWLRRCYGTDVSYPPTTLSAKGKLSRRDGTCVLC